MNGNAQVTRWRKWLRSRAADIAADFDPARPVQPLLVRRAEAIDELLQALWLEFMGETSSFALIATGGYGRRELHPHSDVDILILADETSPPDALREFLTLLWDLGLDLGHSVRTLNECREAAREDISLMTSLMESRLLCGSEDLAEALFQDMQSSKLWPARAYFRAKLIEQIERHRQYDDTAYNLEPNLKGSPGGLRDIQTLSWILKRAEHANIEDLVHLRFIEEDELTSLLEARERLWSIRFQLHLTAERKEDRLLFAHQVALAPIFGFPAKDNSNRAVERFMQTFYRAAIRVQRINGRVMQAMEARMLHDETRPSFHVLAEFDSIGGLLKARDPMLFKTQPGWLLSVFEIVDQRDDIRGIHADTERLIRHASTLIDDAFRSHPEHRDAFLRLWSGRDVPATLQHMHQLEVLDRYLPAFGAVTGRMQFDLFHVYTVDEHTLMVLRNVRSFFHQPDPDRFPMCGEIGARLRKPALLYLAAFFHDIAKGRGGDHSEDGAQDATRFCEDHGLSEAETALVRWLVKEHLLMSVTAQKRDIADPLVINEFARAVGGRVRLSYLYLLTMADIAGTNPKLWNSWKATLLSELYVQTRKALIRGLENPAQRQEWIDDTKAKARRQLEKINASAPDDLWSTLPDDYFLRHSPEQVAWHTDAVSSRGELPLIAVHPYAPRGATEVLVFAKNRDGSFATIAWVLGRLALNIIDARLFATCDGLIIDSFLVLDNAAKPVTDPRTLEVMVERLTSALSEEELSAARSYPKLPDRIKPFWRKPRVETRDGRGGRTELTLECADRPGLLARVALVLLRHGTRVHAARIATFGDRVEDDFVLSDFEDRALTTSVRRELEHAIVAALDATPEDHAADY